MPNAQYFGGTLRRMKLNVSGMKNPLARPLKNCIVRSDVRFGEKGVMIEITAKAIELPIRARRGPKVAPIQTAMTVTNICAAVCAVVIQAPSSNPACTAPRMSARPNEEKRVLRVEMNVPMSTATSPSQGMAVGGVGIVGAMTPREEVRRGSAGCPEDAWMGVLISACDPPRQRLR